MTRGDNYILRPGGLPLKECPYCGAKPRFNLQDHMAACRERGKISEFERIRRYQMYLRKKFKEKA